MQGARNVAIAAINTMKTLAAQSKAQNRKQFLTELEKARQTLSASRETEPLMRNALRCIISQVQESQQEKVKQLAEIIDVAAQKFLVSLEASKDRIAQMGARRVKKASVVFTHCHSSTVTNLLRKAKSLGINFEVIVTETRPMYQGRITAKEMVESGIKTTMIVDSAARHFMNQASIAIVGADAITSEGNIVNKIGTGMIALIAQEARTPFYVATELLKFDPATMYGDYEKIEERNPDEVWKNPPHDLTIRNPAFDVTRRDFIHGLISEEGIISPNSTAETVRRVYPWVFKR